MADLKLNRAGIRQLLTEPGTVSMVSSIAARIASAAGPGMETRPAERGNRARAAVVTATFEARLAEARNRALTRAVGAGRSA